MGVNPASKDIGELAEWSNAAVLKTVDLNGSGGSNPSLSAKHKKKGVKFYLNAFFYCALQRPAAGGEGCRSVATKSLFKNQWTELWTKLS